MQKKQFGVSDWQVGVVGFGGIPIQRISVEASKDVVKTALELGVNFFDTARGYTDSEYKLGLALRESGFPRDNYFLATKSMARAAEGIYNDVLESLKQLNTPYIDLYQMHNVKDEDTLAQVLGVDGALEGLKRAKKEGKIKAIGITGHIMSILVKAIKTKEFCSVQFPFNVVEDQAKAELLPLANELNMATIIMKPLAGGALDEADKALTYILKHPVTVVIPGMESIEQVEQNIKAGTGEVQIKEAEFDQFIQRSKELGQQFCRRCEYCLPCPTGINIPMVFLLNGYWERYGLKQWAIDRYKGMKVSANECIECGQCETRCPYGLPIGQMLKTAHKNLS